jgi:hypothetical protein
VVIFNQQYGIKTYRGICKPASVQWKLIAERNEENVKFRLNFWGKALKKCR